MRWRRRAWTRLEQAMREATGQGGLNNEDSVRLRELERTAAVNKSLFEDFLQKAKITDEQSTFRAREARVIMPAQLGGQSFPNRNRVLMMALLVGIRARRRRRVRNGNAEGRLHDAAPSRGGAGNSCPGLGASDEQEPAGRRTERPFHCHSTSFTIRSRLLAKRCAPCEAASTCRTSTGRPRSSMSRPRVPAKASQPLRSASPSQPLLRA